MPRLDFRSIFLDVGHTEEKLGNVFAKARRDLGAQRRSDEVKGRIKAFGKTAKASRIYLRVPEPSLAVVFGVVEDNDCMWQNWLICRSLNYFGCLGEKLLKYLLDNSACIAC